MLSLQPLKLLSQLRIPLSLAQMTQITIISTFFFTDNEERFIPSTRAFIFDALWPSISKWGLKVDRRYEATRPLTNTGPWFGAGDFRLLLSSRKGFSSENKSYEMPNGTIPTEFGLSDVEVLILQGNLTLKLQRLYITFFRKFPWITSFLAVSFFLTIFPREPVFQDCRFPALSEMHSGC